MSQTNESRVPQSPILFHLLYLLLGTVFGYILTRSEAVSWFRIQEMFHFQSFRMFGMIGTAIATASLGMQLLRRLGVRDLENHQPITIAPKTLGSGIRYLAGGCIFGLGWALTGACPGALFALWGSGISVLLVTILAAVAGAWLYGWLRPRLPH